jgi:hypothetical protein
LLEGLFPGTPERGEAGTGRTPPALRAGGAGSAEETDARTAATTRETEALDRLEQQREALIAQMSRDIEVQGRRAAAIFEGEEAVEALNRQLHIEEALLRSGAEAGTEFYEVIEQLAAAQYDAARAAEEAAASMQTSWTDAAEAIKTEMAAVTNSIEGIFMAWASSGIKGLARYAKAKVLQNLAYAAEAIGRGIFGDPRGFASAAQHGKAALQWGALAGFSSGGGGGASATGGASIGGPSSGPAQRAEPVGPEINIHFIGPGFDATNPEVQRVVYGAEQYAKERFGADAKVRVHRSR